MGGCRARLAGGARGDPRLPGRAFYAKRNAIFLATRMSAGANQREVSGMRLRSIGIGVASLMLVSTLGTGCAKHDDTTATRAEQAAARSEDAARRAEAAASRVEAAAQRAEAAAEKADRTFKHGLRK